MYARFLRTYRLISKVPFLTKLRMDVEKLFWQQTLLRRPSRYQVFGMLLIPVSTKFADTMRKTEWRFLLFVQFRKRVLVKEWVVPGVMRQVSATDCTRKIVINNWMMLISQKSQGRNLRHVHVIML